MNEYFVTESDVEEQLNRVYDLLDSGENPYWGATYIDGLRDALEWVLGNRDAPLEDQD